MVPDIEQLIRDLDSARADGTIFTYGQVQRRLQIIIETHTQTGK